MKIGKKSKTKTTVLQFVIRKLPDNAQINGTFLLVNTDKECYFRNVLHGSQVQKSSQKHITKKSDLTVLS